MNTEEYINIHKDPQGEGVLVYDSDLGVGEGQQCDVATGSGCDYTLFSFDHSTPPALEPGPSNILHLCQVFDLEPDSEVEVNEGPNEELKEVMKMLFISCQV